jgi:hypothetical protein
VTGHAVAGALRGLAPRKELVEHARQDCRRAAKCATRRLDQLRVARRLRDERQRIDVERADQAGVQALEVEHPDVAMHTRERLQDVSALLRGVHPRVARAHAGSDDLQPLQLAQIQEIEGGDAGGDAIRRHAGQFAARERELHDVEFLDDLVREPRIRARVQRECGQVMTIVVHDLADPIAHVAGDCLAFAEHLACDRVERVVIHADERAAQQVDAIEHESS